MTNTSVLRNIFRLEIFLNLAVFFLKLSCRLYRVPEAHSPIMDYYKPMMGNA
jgi:hypothetical protein